MIKSNKLMAGVAAAAVMMAFAPFAATAGTVSGSVTDASGTAALSGAEVTLVERSQTATVQADGSFRFADVPAGTYTLRVSYAGAEEQTQQVTVTETGDVSAQFQLAAATGDTAQVLIIGQRANLTSAISRQRSSDTVQTTLTRDTMGQFPDQNAAEALRRAPGVNVLNDQGEGRFVSVRGLDPNLNSASINGNRVLSTGGDDRMVAMDVIPAELIESIEIKKSLTPDMDGDTIGASIEINTVSALTRKKNFLGGSLEASYNNLNDKTSPKGSLDFSYRVNPNFGIAGGLSYYNREFSTDNIEADDWTVSEDGVVFAETLEYRDYDVQRERYGFTLNFDWRVSDSTSLYARSFYSKFDDTELRRRLVLITSPDFFLDGDDEFKGTVSGDKLSFDAADGRIEVRRDIKDRREWQETSSFAVGGKTFADAWKFTYDLSYSTASQSEDGSIDPMRFRKRFSGTGSNALGLTLDYSDLTRPSYEVTKGALFNDPTAYEMTAFEHTLDESSQDEEMALRFDAQRNFSLDSGSFELKFGGKLRQREKSLDMTYDVFGGYDGDLSLADVAGSQTYGLADMGVVPDLDKVRNLVASDYASFEREDLDTEFTSLVEDYQAKEDIAAGYIQGRYDNGALRVIGGVRVEQTKVELNGNVVTLAEEGAVIDGEELEEDTIFVEPVRFEKDYSDVLPSLNVRYNVSDKLVTRFAVYNSVMRPSFGKMAPRFVIEENDDNERSGEFGNPDLEPYKATNLDATLEYYFAKEGVVQGGVFYKKINDFIVDAEFENGSYAGIDYDEAVFAINGDEAEVFGFEFAYGQAMTFLPAPWDGLLVNFNYTYTDAQGDILGRTIPLPASAEHTANLVLGYEKGPWSLRAAGAYRSSYLDELGGSAEEDRYVRPHFQVDLSAKYRLNDNLRLFGELVNANDATYTAYNNVGGARRLLQYEEYSWTAKFGVKFNY